ncbi:hypothetical protein BJ546DRAFT_1053544 [Cryomyces antarcticus]
MYAHMVYSILLHGLSKQTSVCKQTGRLLVGHPAPSPDADFGMAPTLVPGSARTPYEKDTIVVAQKNDHLYAISAQAGLLFWSTITSPGGADGGLIWGVAVDNG